jgi:hypothetical protein
MKALVIAPKNPQEFKFVAELMNKLGIHTSAIKQEELEDSGLLQLMLAADKTKKVSRAEIMKKLTD